MLALFYQMKTKKRRSVTIFEEYYKNILENMNLRCKDLSTKCRICLQEGNALIYGNDYTEELIPVLESFSNIKINEADGFPKYLCNICSKFVKAAISFRKMAKHANELLKQPVKQEINLFEQTDEQHDYSDTGGSDLDKEVDHKWEKHEEMGEIKKEKQERVKYATKVTCHICNKVINRSYYKEHITMHDPDHKKYVCDVCGKSFRLRCAYHNHSLRHRTDFPYKCQFCPYRGRYAELLKTHMRTHTGDYRYMCTECPARFLFKSNLNSHMLKHKEPKFKCDACKRAFHTKLMLQRHFEADHLGIKNHVCGMCGKAFGYRNAMMKHQRHVHKREKLLFGRMPAYLQAECDNQDTTQ